MVVGCAGFSIPIKRRKSYPLFQKNNGYGRTGFK
jgi:hypothetical protein